MKGLLVIGAGFPENAQQIASFKPSPQNPMRSLLSRTLTGVASEPAAGRANLAPTARQALFLLGFWRLVKLETEANLSFD